LTFPGAQETSEESWRRTQAKAVAKLKHSPRLASPHRKSGERGNGGRDGFETATAFDFGEQAFPSLSPGCRRHRQGPPPRRGSLRRQIRR
jgi:hypothetical protein